MNNKDSQRQKRVEGMCAAHSEKGFPFIFINPACFSDRRRKYFKLFFFFFSLFITETIDLDVGIICTQLC